MANTPGRIPEDRVPAILARAAELDRAVRESTGIDAIRAAALEAGISQAAVDRALDEYAAAELARESGNEEGEAGTGESFRRRWARRLRRPLTWGLAAFGLGIVGGLAGEEVMVVAGFVAFVVAAGRLALRLRPARRARGFIATLIPMTLRAMVGFGSVEGDEDVVIALLMVGIALLVSGTTLIKVRRPEWLRRPGRNAAAPG